MGSEVRVWRVRLHDINLVLCLLHDGELRP